MDVDVRGRGRRWTWTYVDVRPSGMRVSGLSFHCLKGQDYRKFFDGAFVGNMAAAGGSALRGNSCSGRA